MALDDNDLHMQGELPDDAFAGLVRLLPPRSATQPPGAGDEDEATAYEATPDGRPYIVVPPGGKGGWFVATSDGGYRVCQESLVRVTLSRHWPDLEVNRPQEDDDKPPKAMQPAELYARYGCDCDGVYYSYSNKTEFRAHPPHTGDIFVRVCTGETPKAVKHDDVLEFFSVLFGLRESIMLDWFATAPLIDRPTGVPVLLGDNSLGKSMIPLGLSRYFGEAITDYDDVFKDRFNDALLRGPVVWLDETSHVDAKSGRFRKLTGNDRHAIEGKNTPSGTLLGCPRLIVTSNNSDPLALGREELSKQDEDAIGARIILVNCCPEAKLWLEKRGGRKYTADWVTKPDGSPGKIPETIAWLAANRRVTHGPRFLVAGNSTEWAASIGSRKGLPATILDAYTVYHSMDSDERKRLVGDPFLVDDAYPEHLIISNTALRNNWKALLGENAPTHRKVAEALQKLAPAGNEKLTLKRESKPNQRDRIYGYLVPKDALPKVDSDG